MSKKKALGQDPLAWIKLTQEAEEKKKQEAAAPPAVEDGAPVPVAASGMNWPFLFVYIINMVVLLVLVFMVYSDLSAKMETLEKEVVGLQQRVNAMEPVTPVPAGTLSTDLPEEPATTE